MRYIQLGEQFVVNLDKIQFVNFEDKRVKIYMHDFTVVFTAEYEFGGPYNLQIEVSDDTLELIKEALLKALDPYYVGA